MLYSDALISGREGVATHVDPLFVVLSSNGSLIVRLRGIPHHCFQSPLQSSTFLNAAWTLVHLMSRSRQRWVRWWKALHVCAREEREDGVRCSKMQSQTSAGIVLMSSVFVSCNMLVCDNKCECAAMTWRILSDLTRLRVRVKIYSGDADHSMCPVLLGYYRCGRTNVQHKETEIDRLPRN